MKVDTENECAFPAYMHEEMGVREGYFSAGMTKREYFAGQAMTTFDAEVLHYGTTEKPSNPWPWVAKQCVQAADALLAELERTQ